MAAKGEFQWSRDGRRQFRLLPSLRGGPAFPLGGKRSCICWKNAAAGKICAENNCLFANSSRRARLRGHGNGGPQMQYLLLIYHDENRWNALAEAEREEIYSAYR